MSGNRKRAEMVSVRLDGSEVAAIRTAAEARGLTLSAFLREAALEFVATTKAVDALRVARDLLPKIPAVRCRCGNIFGPHSHPECGTPTEMWGKEAWEIEFMARRLEDSAA